MNFIFRRFLFLLLVFCASCSKEFPEVVFKLVDWEDLPRFYQDNLLEALPAMRSSCTSGKYPKGYEDFCSIVFKKTTNESLQQSIRYYFSPYAVFCDDERTGKITGYYEPLLRGSKIRSSRYSVPVYKNPQKNGCEYAYSRTEISQGALEGKKLEILYVDDEIDLFFLQIQGSGLVLMDNGEIIRLGYDGQNGYPYFPVGKELVERGEIELKKASMQSIKKWLRAHPGEINSILLLNQSYVYFRVLKGEGPIGAHGAPLTPSRSLAIDKNYIPLGSFVWIDAIYPRNNKGSLQKMMVAQDTGGAIKGPLRADYFWGFGNEEEENASSMNYEFSCFVFLPKNGKSTA